MPKAPPSSGRAFRGLVAVFSFLLTGCGSGSPGDCASRFDEIGRQIDAWRVSYGFPGLAIGVDTGACGTWTSASGLADVERGVALRADHIIPVGSVSKMAVATVVLQLAEEGLLDLEDPLSGWFADFPNAGSITVRQLLNHTSGVYNYFPDETNPCYQAYATDPGRTWTPEEIIDCARDREPAFAPGAGWGYSNTNYVFLGAIVERLTGNGLYDEVAARVLEPLGMRRTPSKAGAGFDERQARCYQGATDITEKYNPTFAFGCGGMASTAGDLLRLIRAVVDGELLTDPMHREMIACVDTQGDAMGDYGFGIACREDAIAGPLLGHPGRGDGMAELYYAERWDTAFVVLVNHRFNLFNWNRPTDLWEQQLVPALAASRPQD